ncbi:MAG: DUF1707 domain-containing protein [Candidatus Nanopelagicales bacterium]
MSTPDPVGDALRLRASDADRERVASLLRDAFVEGRLSPVEHEERLEQVYKATTYGDLVPLLEDLPLPPGALAVPGAGQVVAVSAPVPGVPTSDGLVILDPARAGEGQGQAVAIFSGVERKGSWVVPPELVSVAIMGGVELDLTDAVLTAQQTEFRVFALMGGIEITVPEGVAVRNETIGIMGGVSTPEGEVPAGAPVLRVTGAAIMGGVDIKRPKPKKPRKLKGTTPPQLGH